MLDRYGNILQTAVEICPNVIVGTDQNLNYLNINKSSKIKTFI